MKEMFIAALKQGLFWGFVVGWIATGILLILGIKLW